MWASNHGRTDADILERADRRDRRREEVVDDDEHAAEAPTTARTPSSAIGDDAPALRVAPRDLDVLERSRMKPTVVSGTKKGVASLTSPYRMPGT